MILCVALAACNGGGNGGGEAFRVDVVAEGLEAADELRLTVKRELEGDAGPGGREIRTGTAPLAGGLLLERPVSLPARLVPPGDGTLYVHAVARSEGRVVGVGDARVGDGAAGRHRVVVRPLAAECDRDGDTVLDCAADGCCDKLPRDVRRAVGDCIDDPAAVMPPDVPDGKQRAAADVHAFAPAESALDYARCDNGLDDDCRAGDASCDAETDADDDGHPIAEDCDDGDPGIHVGAYDRPGDDIDQDCDGMDGLGADADGDGWLADDPDPGRRDCADDDRRRFPTAAELPCDGVDQDCDGADPCPDLSDMDADGVPADEDCDDYDPGVRPGGVEVCGDGIDQDCDGRDAPCADGDEDRDGATGEDDCDEADPAVHRGAPERCGDGVDQDCDGADTPCGELRDGDGDGYAPPADCDDEDGAVRPFAEELCNLVDDDCDGLIDEGVPLRIRPDEEPREPTCGRDVGICSVGRQVCTRDRESEEYRAIIVCLGQTPEEEICDGLDNDCDGMADEPDEGAEHLRDEGTETCGPATDVGECTRGTLFCVDGSLSDCRGAVMPTEEICNGKDDDCDGIPDNGAGGEPLTRPCFDGPEESRNRGRCRDGIQRCEQGRFGACEGQFEPVDEVCNNQDDDCDGAVDEDVRAPCYSGPDETRNVGACTEGFRTCTDGVFGECEGERLPADGELCNGEDDDCDGRIDQFREPCFEGDPALIGVGRCRAGEWACVAGEYTPCRGQILPEAETCDLLDNDCDGEVDEDFDLDTDPRHCGRCGAACAEGEVCCDSRCRRLDTVEACGSCDNACGRNADRCAVGVDGAECRCGDGPACPDAQRCIDGECRCFGDDDCAADELCCDGVCEPTDPEVQCAACDEPCEPTLANACNDRTCECGDTTACLPGTFCEQGAGADDRFLCRGCRHNGDCQAGTLCCDNVCVAADPDVQCEACGERCPAEAADRCIEAGVGPNRGGRCVCGESGAPCRAEDGTPYCVDGVCRQCRNDADCPGEAPRCVDHVCRACNPADHGPCGPNELCCAFDCQPTGSGAGQQCEACGQACDVVATNVCAGRTCGCGDGPPCGGDTPICDDARGVCVQCRSDGDCAPYPGRGECVDNVCRVCDPNGHDGCEGERLCCLHNGEPRCESTGPAVGDQCEACDVACDTLATNVCVGRTCGCGDGLPCADPTPVCDDAAGECVECITDAHCNRFPGRSQCVDNVCRPCDPADHAGCGADQLCCDFQCEATGGGPGEQCTACGVACDSSADTCRGRTCVCGDSPDACAEPTGFCVGGSCEACRNHNDCRPDELCCGGACVPTGAEAPAACEACGSACNAVATNACVNRDCRCGANPPCGGATPICDDAAGECVQCLGDGDCAGRPGQPECVDNVCRACDPADHAGCAEDGAAPICDAGDLTCRACGGDAECAARPGDRDQCVGGQCELCDPADNSGCGGDLPTCDAATLTCRACEADADCNGLQCVGGRCEACDPNGDAGCSVATPICDPDTLQCRACGGDAECVDRAGAADQCVDGRCSACDPADHAGCGPDQLCCDFQCEATAPGTQCEACDTACPADTTNACDDRTCLCGAGQPCAGDTPFCDDAQGVCVECLVDGDCDGGLGQCVDGTCRACDPADDAGCDPGGVTPICDAQFQCVGCAADADCAALGGQCLGDGSCAECDPGDHGGCVEDGDAPICDDGSATCRACQRDAECDDRPGTRNLCDNGQCVECTVHADCGGEICDGGTCVACQGDADCAGHPNGQQCVGGACVECGEDADCGGELCVANVCVACGDHPDCAAHPDGNLCSGELCTACQNDGDCVAAGVGRTCTNGRCK